MNENARSDFKNSGTFLLCFLAALVEGYDLQAAAVTMQKLIAEFKLTPQQTTWVPTSNTLGLLIGAAIGGWLADRLGRKQVLIGSMLGFGVFSIGTALASGPEMLLLTRFLVGLGLGGAMPNIIALVAETGASENHSARTQVAKVTALSAGIPFGGFLSTVLALSMGADFEWEVLFHVGGAAPIAIALLMIPFLNESPSFLRSRSHGRAGARRISTIETLFEGKRATATLLLWTSFLLTLIVLYLLLNWLPLLMSQKGLSPVQGTWIASMFSLGGSLGAVALASLVRFGLQRVLTTAYALMAVSVYALAIVSGEFYSALTAGFMVGFFVVGAQYALYGLSPTFYPSDVRGTGVGAAVSVGRIGAVLGPYAAGRLLEGGRSGSEVILAILPIILVALVATVALTAQPQQEVK